MGSVFSNILSLIKSEPYFKEDDRKKPLNQQKQKQKQKKEEEKEEEEEEEEEEYLTISDSEMSEEELKKESKINITLSHKQVSAVVGEVIKDFKKTYSLKEGSLNNQYFKLNQGDELMFSDLIKSCKKSERVCKQSRR